MYLEIYDISRYMCPHCGEIAVIHHLPESPNKYNPDGIEANCSNCGWSGLWTDKLSMRTSYFLEIRKRSRI